MAHLAVPALESASTSQGAGETILNDTSQETSTGSTEGAAPPIPALSPSVAGRHRGAQSHGTVPSSHTRIARRVSIAATIVCGFARAHSHVSEASPLAIGRGGVFADEVDIESTAASVKSNDTRA
ncbi:MAG: hypothetical protein U0Q12_21040 [Vicinamibacterales bacterium]